MTTAYKHKIYMGKSINWNQLIDKSKFRAMTESNGITAKNNGDGTFTLNGTYNKTDTTWINFYVDTSDISLSKKLYGHKILYGCVQNPSAGSQNNEWGICYEINSIMFNAAYTRSDLGESAVIVTLNKVALENITSNGFYFYFRAPSSGTAVYKDVVVRPQLFDLTQMFGAGNEPSTVEEFWSYFPNELYPYNEGETQPLFKISRKRKLYMGKSVEWNQMVQNPIFSNTVVDTRKYVSFRVQQLASPYDSFCAAELQEPGLVSAIFTITASGNCRIKHNGIQADIDFCYFTSVKDHKYYIYFNFTSTNPTVAGGVTYDKAQLFDLTQMFGAGNEPATPEEFWSYFSNQTYPYNAGETQPLFKISRKSVYGGNVVTYPKKGDLITLDDKEYRVLKINDSVAEVLAMYSATE